jgi:hypothetical protein
MTHLTHHTLTRSSEIDADALRHVILAELARQGVESAWFADTSVGTMLEYNIDIDPSKYAKHYLPNILVRNLLPVPAPCLEAIQRAATPWHVKHTHQHPYTWLEPRPGTEVYQVCGVVVMFE